MILDKEYVLINTYDLNGDISKETQHRVGRTGEFLILEVGRGFKFIYGKSSYLFKSSIVEKIEELDNKLIVHTLNTIYEFKVLN